MRTQFKLKTQLQKGFTLVELLIVVIILAILAAIVVPQFASSTDDAKSSAVDSTLANVRAAIQLYYQQHGKYPGSEVATGATCPSPGTAPSSGAANTQEAFLAQMSNYTSAAGKACSTSDGTYKYGPYLSKGSLPPDPDKGSSNIVIVTTGNLVMNADSGDLGGYKYDTKNGKIIVNLTAYQTR